MYSVKQFILMMVCTLQCVSCYQLPWPVYNSASNAASQTATSGKYLNQNVYSNDGNKEEHSSTTFLDGSSSASDKANAFSEPSLGSLAKILPFIANSLDFTPIKKQSSGDKLSSLFPTSDMVQSFSLLKQPLLETIPAAITEPVTSMIKKSLIPVEPVLSVFKKPISVLEYEPRIEQESIQFDKLNPIKNLIEIPLQYSNNLCDNKAENIDSDKLSETYKSNLGEAVFELLIDDESMSSSSDPELDELTFIIEEVPMTDEANKDAEVIAILPSMPDFISYDSMPMYSAIPNYYYSYMQPYPFLPIQPNNPNSAMGYPYKSADVLSNMAYAPVPVNEVLLPEPLYYGNIPLQYGMPQYYSPLAVQQYPLWSNHNEETNRNKVHGTTASASPISAASDSLSRSTSYTTDNIKRF